MTRARRLVLSVLSLAVLLAGMAVPASAQGTDLVEVDYQVLTQQTQDPLAIQVTSDGRVIWTEREGALKVLRPDGTMKVAARVPVSANQCNDCVVADTHPLEEGGLHGLLLAQDFDDSGRIYLFRSVPGSRDPETGFGVFRLSTFVLDDADVLHLDSEEPIIEVPVYWDQCCHYGGNLEWLPDGTILLSTGDDVPASSSGGYGPRDTRNHWLNAELSSANPADRRGKVLRLLPDGSVPDGTQEGIAANPFIGQSGHNPYIPDTSGTPDDGLIEYDPYIYSLGYKQPFRGAVHPKTGTAYFSDIGPDAVMPADNRGPRGHDELNVVKPGGGVHHGWPRCVGPNWPYTDVDWVTGASNGPLDCSEMEPAVFYYPHDVSAEWPQVGAGLVSGIPAAFYPAETEGALRLPASWDDQLIDMEFSRDWLATIPVRADGTLDTSPTAVRMRTPFRPSGVPSPSLGIGASISLAGPIDATVGPDGALYILEYGKNFYNNSVSRVSRLTCAGCTADAADYGLPAGSRVDFGLGGLGGAAGSAPPAGSGGGALPLRPAGALGLGGLLLLGAALGRRRTVA